MRFKLLEDTRQEAETALPVLERHVDSSVLPLPLTVSDLGPGRRQPAQGTGSSLFRHRQDNRQGSHQKGLHSSSAAHSQSRNAPDCSTPEPGLQHLRSPFVDLVADVARALPDRPQLARHHPETNITRLEHQYLSTLLFAYLEPSKLPRDELTVAIFCTQQLAVHAVIAESHAGYTHVQGVSALTSWYARTKASPGTPLLRLAKGTPIFDGFIVDCSSRPRRAQQVCRAGKRLRPQRTRTRYSTALRQTLQLAIGSQSMRRFGRMQFRPHADLVAEFPRSFPSLRAIRFHGDSPTWQVAPNGRSFTPSEWSLIDQSPDGFLVRFIQGDSVRSALATSSPCSRASRARCTSAWCAASQAPTRVDSNWACRRCRRKSAWFRLPGHGEIRRGIYLHSLPAFGNRPGIIARPGHLASGHKIKLEAQGSNHLLQVGRRLEASEGLEFFALVPL